MKNIASIILVASAFLFNSCAEHIKGNGNVQSREQDLESFEAIVLSGMFDVELTEGKEKIEVVTDENIHEHISVRVSDNTLVVSSQDKYLNAEQLLLRISYKSLKKVNISGAAEIKSKDPINSKQFKLDVSGACEGDLEFDVKELDIDISGGGELNLRGKADYVDIHISGAGEINGLDLQAQEAKFDITGAGEIEMAVEKALGVAITGAGEVRYFGNPAVNKNITGAGEIKQLK